MCSATSRDIGSPSVVLYAIGCSVCNLAYLSSSIIYSPLCLRGDRDLDIIFAYVSEGSLFSSLSLLYTFDKFKVESFVWLLAKLLLKAY